MSKIGMATINLEPYVVAVVKNLLRIRNKNSKKLKNFPRNFQKLNRNCFHLYTSAKQ